MALAARLRRFFSSAGSACADYGLRHGLRIKTDYECPADCRITDLNKTGPDLQEPRMRISDEIAARKTESMVLVKIVANEAMERCIIRHFPLTN